MKFLFEQMTPQNGDTEEVQVDLKHFRRLLQKKDVQMWMQALDYDASDADLLFYLIDERGDGHLTLDELTEGMATLRGSSRNIDVKLLLYQSQMGRMMRSSS